MIQYESYKKSGIEWLGDIPKEWNLIRVKDIIQKIGSGVTPKGGSEIYTDKGVPFLRSQNVYNDGLRIDDVSFITESIHNKMKNSQLKPNDILINITGASIGRTCIVPLNIKEANINQHIIYVRCKEEIVPYISNYFKTNLIQEHINRIQAGTSKEALNMGQVLTIPALLPPLEEQITIANYLDKKTNGINSKVKLLTKKISTYKELRKSIIKQAVTKGLDKNVQLEDSGVNWLGTFPVHWNLKRIKDIFLISRGRPIAKTELKDNGLYPVYSSQTKKNGELGCINTFDFDTDLLTWTTDGANAGTVFKRAGKFSCTNICGTLTPIYKDKISLEYFVYSVQESTIHNKRIDTNGAKIMSNEMAVINIVIPPLKEQLAISKYLDQKTSKIDAIVNNIGSQINHLKELRKSLINDVVTGKIKVI